jgi:hypothetical protein
VKSPVCKTCGRDGDSCDSNFCKIGNYTANYECDKLCKNLDRCGEIDLCSEGLSVVGQFINTYVRLEKKNSNLFLKQHKILWTHALSG